MKKNTKWKFIWNILLLIVIFGLMAYFVKNSLAEIFLELANTDLKIIIGVTILGLAYQFFEGWSIKEIVQSFSDEFSTNDGMQTAWYVAFYRVITFGAGTLISEVNFYNRKGLKVSQGMGVTSLHMIMYKAAILTYGIIALVLQFSLLYTESAKTIPIIILGMLMTLGIILFFLIISVSINVQVGFILLCHRLFKTKKMRNLVDSINLKIYSLRETVTMVLNDRTALIRIYLLNLIKLAMWYLIPYISLIDKHPNLDFLLVFSLISFTLILAGVIPSPAGIGPFEFVYLYLFTPLVGTVDAVSTMLLYRFASYVLPFLLGFILFLVERKRIMSLELEEIKIESNKI